MSERSIRLKRDTSPENVIAAFNGLADRVDRFVFLQTLRDEPADVKAAKQAKASSGLARPISPLALDIGSDFSGFRDATGRRCGLAEVATAYDDLFELAASEPKPAAADEPLTPADVRPVVEHAVRETRTGIPDATAPWTLHLGPGCTVENTESGNRFTVEPGNAIVLDAEVKLRVLDKAEGLIDPERKAKPVRWSMSFIEVPMSADGNIDWHDVERMAKLKILEAKLGN